MLTSGFSVEIVPPPSGSLPIPPSPNAPSDSRGASAGRTTDSDSTVKPIRRVIWPSSPEDRVRGASPPRPETATPQRSNRSRLSVISSSR